MGRIARYDPVANIVETLTGVDVNPRIVIGKTNKILVGDDTARACVYDVLTGVLSCFDVSIVIDDIFGNRVVGRSGSVVYLLDTSGNTIASYDVGVTLNKVALKSMSKAIVVYNGGGRVIDFSTTPPTVVTLNIDPNANHLFVDCNDNGYCVITSNIHRQSWHGNPYTGCDWSIINPDDTVGAIEFFGNISVAFCSNAYVASNTFTINREQNNAVTVVELRRISPPGPISGITSGTSNNPAHTFSTENTAFGNFASGVVLVRKPDATVSLGLGYSIRAGFASEYDTATKIAYVLIDKNNNIIAGRIDRTTATIISETPVSRLSVTPRIFKPVVI